MVRSGADKRTSWVTGTVASTIPEAAYEVFAPDANPHKAVIDDFGLEAGSRFPAPPLPAGRFTEFGFGIEFMGSDTANVPSILGRLLQACGMTETPTANGKTEYAYTADEAITVVRTDLRYYDGGIEWIMLNNVGSFIIDAPGGNIPTATFNWLGNIDPSNPVGADQASPKAITDKVAALPVQNNAFTITPAGQSAISPDVLQWTFDQGNVLYGSPNVGGAFGFDLPEILRSNSMATLRVEVDDPDDFNPNDHFYAKDVLAISTFLEDGLTPPAGDGHECAIDFAGKIPEKPIYSENEDAKIWEFKIQVTRGNGLSLVWLEI